MADGDVREDRTLSMPARAIKYILDRVQVDANLRHYLLHTQAHALLIAAEAEQLGVGAEEHAASRSRWLGKVPPDVEVLRLRNLLEDLNADY